MAPPRRRQPTPNMDMMPRKPMNPYMAFIQEHRPQVVKDNPQMSVREVVSHMANLWRQLSPESRAPYVARAQLDKARFEEERSRWLAGPPKKSLNSYMMFAQEQRENVMKANPEMTVREVVSHTATLWRNMTDEQKAPYIAKASTDKARFDEERARWVAQSKDMSKRGKKKASKKDKGKKGKKGQQPKKIKRVCSAFIYFSRANRRAVQTAHPDWKMGDVSKELGRLWREMNANERAPFQQLHDTDKERHRQEVSADRATTAPANMYHLGYAPQMDHQVQAMYQHQAQQVQGP